MFPNRSFSRSVFLVSGDRSMRAIVVSLGSCVIGYCEATVS